MASIEAYLHAKFDLDPSNRLATVHRRHRQDRETDRTDGQRSDSTGRTVLETVAKNWSDEWLLSLNNDKCKSVSYCIKHPDNTDYHIMNRYQLYPLEKVQSIFDLGFRFDT